MWRTLTATIKKMWAAYTGSQRLLHSTILLAGMLTAGLTSYFGPKMGKLTTGGELLEYEVAIDSAQPTALTDYIDVANYAGVTIFTQTTAPERATVIMYGLRNDRNVAEIRRIASGPTWTKWEEGISYNSLRLVVERSSEGSMPPVVRYTDAALVQPPGTPAPANQGAAPRTTPDPTSSPANTPPGQPAAADTPTPQRENPPRGESPPPTVKEGAAPANQPRVKVIIFLKRRQPATQ